MERVYNKLVRDNIPNIIKTKGEEPIIKVLDDETYKKLGIKKVSMKLYDHMRHEILNETEKEMVFDDVSEFVTK